MFNIRKFKKNKKQSFKVNIKYLILENLKK